MDLTYGYDIMELWYPLHKAVRERYGGTIDTEDIVRIIRALVRSPPAFSKLYKEPEADHTIPSAIVYAPPGFGKTTYAENSKYRCADTDDHLNLTQDDWPQLLSKCDIVLTNRIELLTGILPAPVVFFTADKETLVERMSKKTDYDTAVKWADSILRHKIQSGVRVVRCSRTTFVGDYASVIEDVATSRKVMLSQDPSLPRLE